MSTDGHVSKGVVQGKEYRSQRQFVQGDKESVLGEACWKPLFVEVAVVEAKVGLAIHVAPGGLQRA